MKVYNVNVCAMLAFCGLKLEMTGLFAMSLTKQFVFNVLWVNNASRCSRCVVYSDFEQRDTSDDG
ncbi:hypothetical protein [Vibrio sp. E14]|uniref:hypothetical protein n=1 Tax=Vibrio sp. E14 TaxID=2849869 RepID=UPI001CF8DDDE|nr:hypothetical protein [Vibrio sp. E14]